MYVLPALEERVITATPDGKLGHPGGRGDPGVEERVITAMQGGVFVQNYLGNRLVVAKP